MITIKSYPKSQLAMLYFPDSDPHTAQNRLASWIHRCPELKQALSQCNISKFSKFYSARQVALILDYLGEP